MGEHNQNRREFIKAGATGTAAIAIGGTRGILGANDRIRLGIIGCGGRGNYLLRQTALCAQELNVEIAALCDVWKVNLRKTVEAVSSSQNQKPVTHTRYLEMLDQEALDAVVIATPDFAHTPILIDAVKAGKDAFVEKPMATRMDHAAEALKSVPKQKVIVQVGTQRRSETRYQVGAELVQSGVLGHVSEVEAAWHDNRPRWARKYDQVREEDVDWEQYLMDLPKEPFKPERFRRWHLYQDFTVGTPGLLGSHLIDVATWFMDDPLPRSAVAHGGVYVWKDGREHADTIDCVLEYPKGFVLNYSTRLGNKFPIPAKVDRPLPTTFYGTKGTFDTNSWRVQSPEGVELARVAEFEEEVSHVRNWLECIRSRREPNAPVQAGYAHSVASICCFEAWRSGRRQTYDAETGLTRAG
jgi:predicted dehydrogenase